MSEIVPLTIDEFNRLMLGDNTDLGISNDWSVGSVVMYDTWRLYNVALGSPVISFPIDRETGQKYIDINFINNTTFRVYYYEVGGLGVHGIGNDFSFHLINNVTHEDITITAVSLGSGDEPLGNPILGKSLFFAVLDNSILTGDPPIPTFGLVSNASVSNPRWGQTDTQYDFWYHSWTQVPDWFLEGNKKPDYPGEESDTGGGSGSYIGRNDVIGIPNFPSISALGTGFINAYNPSTANLEAFSNWLWSSDFSENVKKNQASPFDNIISFGFVPLGLTTTYDTIHIGNYDTQIGCNKIITEYYPIDSDWLDIYEYWGGFLDYQAEYQIYLPYIGYQPIRASEFVDGKIRVVYHISCLTGLLQCYVQCMKNGVPHVLYSFCGNCFSDLPINGANFLQMKLQLQQSVVNGVTGAINGAIQGAQSGGIIGAVGGLIGGAVGGGYNYAMNKASAKPDYQHGGGLSGNGGMFAIRYPYLIETKQITQIPKNYNKLVGIPSMVTRKLSDLTGYTEVYEVLDEQLTCTESEKKQIYELLKGGVYIND